MKKTLLILSILTLVLTISACSKTINCTTKIESQLIETTTQATTIEDIKNVSEYKSIEVDCLNKVISLDIDDTIIKVLKKAQNAKQDYTIKEAFVGDLYITDNNNNRYLYGNYIVDTEGNRYIKYYKSNCLYCIENISK